MIEQSIPERFEQQVQRHPDRPAVRTGTVVLSYRELNQLANRIARAVLDAGPEGERVVLLFDQGPGVVAAALGVLKAGKTYVPLDPALPASRAADMLEDAQASVVVAGGRHVDLARRLAAERDHHVVDADAVAHLSGENVGRSADPSAPAYMLYTSGSTGRPKGVLQTHRNLLHFVRSYTNSFGITAEDRIAWVHSMAFSASNMNVYPALLNGATLCPYDVKTRGVGGLAERLMEEQVTICQCVPTVFRHFLAGLSGDEHFPDMRVWELGGEPLFRADVDQFRRHFPATTVLANRLAFTEASFAAQYVIDPETVPASGPVPVGRPGDGVRISLVGEDGAPVAPGEVGEIVLSSHHLSPGYWRRPDLTAAAFGLDPDEAGRRIYRTGDLGRIRPDGLLEYFGRKDFRVKVRGYTIEVAEIEAELVAHDGVAEAVVVAKEDRTGDKRLIAYVVPADSGLPGDAALREHLANRLPDYMVPAAFVRLESLPVTSTGKVDRRALPDREPNSPAAGNGYLAPRTPLEQAVSAIWAEVFGLDRVGVTDDFLALGGHSLLAGQVVARVHRRLGVELPPGALFEAPTVAELSDRIEAATVSESVRA